MKFYLLAFVLINLFYICKLYVSLNTPTILLPWSSNKTGTVNFELKAHPESACLQWKLQSYDVVSILKRNLEGTSYLGDSTKCSNSILLSPITTEPKRYSTIIMAKNSIDTYLRCDVIIDKIKRIEIVTRTRELSVGEMFENIEIVGYDDNNNVFNSLIGLAFKWTIKPSPNSSIKDINSIMKITNFGETSYSTDPKISELESKGLHGSSIMIEPINTGEVILTATFKDPLYSEIISNSVVILVRGDIFIGELSDIYTLTNTIIDLNPRRLVRRKFLKISLPSPQYVVNISNSNIVSLEKGKIRTRRIGETVVSIIDKYIPHGKHSSIPSVKFHVVSPNIIDVSMNGCLAGENCWYIKTNSSVSFTVNLFSGRNFINYNNIILLSEINLSNQSIAKIDSKHSNGSIFSLKASLRGKNELKVTVIGYINDEGLKNTFEKPLEFFKTFYVVDPIRVNHYGSDKVVEEVYLVESPNPYNKPINLHFEIYGGTKEYTWKLLDLSQANVVTIPSELGHIVIRPIVGVYRIKISDSVALYAEGISKILTIIVQPIDHFKFSKNYYETYTNESLTTPIHVYIKHPILNTYQQVYKYAPLPFRFTSNLARYTLFLYDDSTSKLSNGAQLIFNHLGEYQLRADLLLPNRPPLKAETLISAYDHLTILKSCEMYSALPGSDIVLTTVGGPYSKQGFDNEFFAKIELVIDQSNISGSKTIFSNKFPILKSGNVKTEFDTFTFSLSCSNVGSHYVKLTLGNRHLDRVLTPLVETITIGPLICAHPSEYDFTSLSIKGWENVTDRHCTNIYMRYDTDFVVKIQLIHRLKNLPICEFPKHLIPTAELHSINQTKSRFFEIKYSEQQNSPNDFSGYYLLKNEDKFLGTSKLDISLNYSFGNIKHTYRKELFMNFISLPQFSMKQIQLLNHFDDFLVVPVIGGSSKLLTVLSDSSIVDIKIDSSLTYKEKASFDDLSMRNSIKKVAIFKPKKTGEVSVKLLDGCLPKKLPTEEELPLHVRVASLRHIFVNFTSKIMIGSSSLIEISLYDENMIPISQDKFHLINFTYQISTEAFISVEKFSSLWPDKNNKRFWIIRPLAVGTTTMSIIASLSATKNMIYKEPVSSTIVIETYDPLRVSPNKIYAIPHMTFQLNLRGGPAVSSDHRIEYHFDSNKFHDFIDVFDQSHSIYTKNEGQVTITLKSMSISTNQILSQAIVTVICSKLESVHIESTSQVVLQNNTVVAKARMRNSLGYFTTFGILPSSISFLWDIPFPNEIVSSYWISGFDSLNDGSECINLQLNDLGRFSLQLKAYVSTDYLQFVDNMKTNLHTAKPDSSMDITHYLFSKRDFETIPRLSVEPPKSLQLGLFNWKHHDRDLVNSLPIMSDYYTNEYLIPVDGTLYVINSDYNNLWIRSDPLTVSNTNIDSVIHWTIISSNPTNLIHLNCRDSVTTISNVGDNIQCSNQYLHIKSVNFKGDAVIMANKRFQSRPVIIKVKSVSQLSLILISELKAARIATQSKRWFAFPIGYSAKFKLVAMDEHGEMFSTIGSKNFITECINCKNILLKNMIDDDGSILVTMKYPGNVAVKISHVDEPHIYYTLHFIVIHGLEPKYGQQLISAERRDNQLTDTESYLEEYSHDKNSGVDSSATIIQEITIKRPLGMVYMLAPIFSIETDILEWILSDENNVMLLWKNATHALLYPLRLGDSKLTVMSLNTKQPIGYAILSNILPQNITFNNSNDIKYNYISNFANFEICYPILVHSEIVNEVYGRFDTKSNKIVSEIRRFPFDCNLSYSINGSQNFYHNYIATNFATFLRVDLSKFVTECCVHFIGDESKASSLLSNSNNNMLYNFNVTNSSLSIDVHLNDFPEISMSRQVYFIGRFSLSTKAIINSNGDVKYFSKEKMSDDLIKDSYYKDNISVVLVSKDGSISTALLRSDPFHLQYITATISHTNCFEAELARDHYSHRSLLLRIKVISNDCFGLSNENMYIEIRSSLTGQTIRRKIMISDETAYKLYNSRSTWFFLKAAFDTLPKVISIDLTTVFFTLLSIIGTMMVVAMLSGDNRFSLFFPKKHQSTNAGISQPFNTIYKNSANKTPNSSIGSSGVTRRWGSSQTNNIKLNNPSSFDYSKPSIKSTGALPSNQGAIYDDNYARIIDNDTKPYNISH